MICKAFEIRDEGTHIPALAIKLLPHDKRERLILARAGYGDDITLQGCHILLMRLGDVGSPSLATTNPIRHRGGRTMKHAHFYIEEFFDLLPSGSVIDVQYVLGETHAPCVSELDEDRVIEDRVIHFRDDHDESKEGQHGDTL
jgi:hypothetical protein